MTARIRTRPVTNPAEPARDYLCILTSIPQAVPHPAPRIDDIDFLIGLINRPVTPALPTKRKAVQGGKKS